MARTLHPLLALALLALPALPASAGGARDVELVLALDTTGSMGGLIQRAKEELWTLVDRLGSAPLTPRIRVGIVAYRDRGDAYVTRVFPLDADIDAVYERLMGLEAGGGGDGPESVNRALYDAVTRIAWSDRPGVERAVILAGDAPPHMDYPDDVPWRSSARTARRKGIVIHAIQCGSDPRTRETWNAIATEAGGAYAALDTRPERSRGTPFDAQLASLNRELAGTLVPYGDAATRARTRASADRAAETEGAAAAARASYLGRRGAASTDARGDLAARLAEGSLDWESVDESQLPERLRSLPPAERRQHLEDQIARRRGLLSEIAWLSEKRDAWLSRPEASAGFQRAVLDALVGGEP